MHHPSGQYPTPVLGRPETDRFEPRTRLIIAGFRVDPIQFSFLEIKARDRFVVEQILDLAKSGSRGPECRRR